jgi:hypothetical protein
MVRRPSASGFALSIDPDFDDTKNYRVRLHDLVEQEATYPGAKPGTMALVWKMSLHREDGTPFLDPSDGDLFEFWKFSSDSMFRTAYGRGYVEAFMGRELTDEEVDKIIDDGFAETLIGRTALASFEITADTDGNEKLKLLALRPDKPRAASASTAAPAPTPEPAATPAADPVAARAARPQTRRPRV